MAPPDASLETADPSPPSHRRRWAIGIAVWAVVLGVVAFRFLTEDEAAPSASTAEALVLDLRVVDAAGAPVTGASVALRLDGEGPPLEAEIETNGAGQARIGGLRTGPASVDVVAEGFLPATETFELTENHALLVTLEKSRPLTGRVVDTSGGPIRAVSVRVESEDREQRFCEVETDAAGEFRCEVPEAPVSVEGRAPGYEVLAVVAGVTEDTVSLMLRRAGGIHGRVQGGPAGAVGASVTLGGSGVWPPRSVDVNPEGRFSFLGVPTGVYELRAYHPDGRVSAPAEGLVLEEGDTLEIDLRLGPGAILAGLVQTAEDGTPIADAEVLVAEESLFVSPRAARTDAEGRFEVRGLRPFLHRITVRAPGFVTTQERREPTAEEVFELRRGAVVYGTVTDPEGYPVGGALLGVTGVDEGGLPMLLDGPERAFQEALFEAQLRGPTGVQPSGELGVTLGEVPPIPSAPVAARGPTETSAPRDRYVTDADGRFRLSDLPPGQLQLTADHIDFAPTLSAPILTQPGGEHEVTLVLTPAGTLRGRVLDARDFPAPFVRVELQSEAERQPRAGLTDPDGFFEFTGVPENVTVTAFPVNFPPIRKTLTVLPGEVTETELRLEEAVERLALRVFDDREFPLGGARVNITSLRAASPFSRIGFSEDDGTLVFETLPEPPWKLQLVAAGFAQREVEVDTVPDGELSIALEPGTEIRGRFVDDFQDVPVAGVRVAMQNDDLDRGARSDPEGGFVFEDVPAGRYRLRATAPQHLPLEIEIDLQRRSRGLYPIDLDVLRLLPAGSVRGTVVDPYGTAIAGAEVAIDESFTDAVRTDPQGRFRIEGVAPGEHPLFARHPAAGVAEELRVTVRRLEESSDVVLRMTQEATGAPALGEGELSGVAVDVASVDGAVQIRRVVPGSAAARAGLRVGDEVVTVDGESAIVASQARAMLRGAPGVEAIIEVRRRGRNRRIVVRRERYR